MIHELGQSHIARRAFDAAKQSIPQRRIFSHAPHVEELGTTVSLSFFVTRFMHTKMSFSECHIPPVMEAELFERMKADDIGKTAAGIAAWTCKRCSKKAAALPNTNPSIQLRAPPSVSQKAQVKTGVDRTRAGSSNSASKDTHADVPTIDLTQVARRRLVKRQGSGQHSSGQMFRDNAKTRVHSANIPDVQETEVDRSEVGFFVEKLRVR